MGKITTQCPETAILAVAAKTFCSERLSRELFGAIAFRANAAEANSDYWSRGRRLYTRVLVDVVGNDEMLLLLSLVAVVVERDAQRMLLLTFT